MGETTDWPDLRRARKRSARMGVPWESGFSAWAMMVNPVSATVAEASEWLVACDLRRERRRGRLRLKVAAMSSVVEAASLATASNSADWRSIA